MSYPATFLDIQEAVLAKGRLDPTEDRAKVKDWINQAQTDAVLRTEALVGVATMTPVAGCTSQTLGNAALRIKALYASYGGQQYHPLEPIGMERILEHRIGAAGSNEVPRYYALMGLHTLEFWPTPQANTTLYIYYVKAPTVLSDDAEVPEIPEPYASKLLEYGALSEAAEFKRDEMQDIWSKKYDLWVGKLQSHLNRIAGGVAGQLLVYGTNSLPPHDPSADIRGW